MSVMKKLTTLSIVVAAFFVAKVAGEEHATEIANETNESVTSDGMVMKKQQFSTDTITRGVDCYRDCTADPAPRVCFFEFTSEPYSTLNGACNFCKPNVTNFVVNDCECIEADGVERSIIAVNRMIPGPAVYVCKNDKVIVDLHQHMEGNEATIHWHGIEQRGTPFSDGVPFITQCPIHSGNIFRYEFVADHAGTYLWHSHSGLQKYNGMSGSVVVRESRDEDPHSDLYDVDTFEYTMFIQDWLHQLSEENYPGLIRKKPVQLNMVPANILINGKGIFRGEEYDQIVFEDPGLAYFNVTPGKRYRFRMINAFSGVCPAELTVEGHKILLIGSDAYNVQPVEVDSIISMTGERFDFVIEASKEVRSYWIQVRGLYNCARRSIQQLAILKYDGAPDVPPTPSPTYQNHLENTITVNPLDGHCEFPRTDGYCINQLNNSDLNAAILSMKPDMELYIPFQVYRVPDQRAFYSTANLQRHFVPTLNPVLGLVNKVSYMFPNSPPVSQYKDVEQSFFCNGTSCQGDYCACTNLQKIPLNAVVDLILVDTANISNLYHPMHLHGMSFHVLAVGHASDLNLTDISVTGVRTAKEHGEIPLRLDPSKGVPPTKDTVSVPTNGFAIVRFIADNPGFWMLHCHIDLHAITGMAMIFQVGEVEDLPPVPPNFPVCNNFKPEIKVTWEV